MEAVPLQEGALVLWRVSHVENASLAMLLTLEVQPEIVCVSKALKICDVHNDTYFIYT